MQYSINMFLKEELIINLSLGLLKKLLGYSKANSILTNNGKSDPMKSITNKFSELGALVEKES